MAEKIEAFRRWYTLPVTRKDRLVSSLIGGWAGAWIGLLLGTLFLPLTLSSALLSALIGMVCWAVVGAKYPKSSRILFLPFTLFGGSPG